jgi:hypothetical protein
MASSRICSIEGCGKPEFNKGWCASHFARWRDRGDPLAPKAIKKCSIHECDEIAAKRGWCEKHYQRWKKYRDPLKTVNATHQEIKLGDRFGRLTVIALVSTSPRARWRLMCDCGNETAARADALHDRKQQSCGCYHKDAVTKHGHYGTSTWTTWASMLTRCRNENEPEYPNYGGRGISVCDRWRSFENFLADMGERPKGMTIDRIDVNGNYEPGNCQWATAKQQARNRRNNVIVRYQGRYMCVAEALELSNISYKTFTARIKRGWSAEDALQVAPYKGPYSKRKNA